jgi:hypothetical protein
MALAREVVAEQHLAGVKSSRFAVAGGDFATPRAVTVIISRVFKSRPGRG